MYKFITNFNYIQILKNYNEPDIRKLFCFVFFFISLILSGNQT